ncbi:hypothetical protein COSO111634_05265 [Corallococcus soli]
MRAAYAVSRSSLRADSRNACGPVASTPRSSRGHSSTTTWALEPPAPNALMAATRGRSPATVQSASSRCTTKGVPSKRRCGLSVSACSDGTSLRCRIWSTTLVSAAMPAAASRCPMFDFTEPMAHVDWDALATPNARLRPASSMGSPSAVPVPWAST